MKIAHIHSHTGINGVATSLNSLINLQVARGHRVMLVHRPGAWLPSKLSHLAIDYFESPLKTRISEFYRVGEAIRRWNADVIHTHGGRAHEYGAVFRCAGKIPIVATAHNCFFQLHWIFNNRVIAPSQRTADFHRRFNRVRRRNIRIIPYPMDIRTFPLATQEQREQQREKLGLPSDAFVFGMIGEVCARKNQIDCVRILRNLRRGGVEAHLILIGPHVPDQHMAELKKLIEQAGLIDAVHMPGARPQAAEMLPAFDVYINTSTHEECPVAPVEAMASGLPIISSDVGCMDMLLANELDVGLFAVGDYVGMADYAAKLASDQALRENSGAQARVAIAEKLSPNSILPQIEAVYTEVSHSMSVTL